MGKPSGTVTPKLLSIISSCGVQEIENGKCLLKSDRSVRLCHFKRTILVAKLQASVPLAIVAEGAAFVRRSKIVVQIVLSIIEIFWYAKTCRVSPLPLLWILQPALP